VQSISVLIFARNEHQDLPGCLRSLSWCDDIHVYDSCSTDETIAIAKTFGAKVSQRPGEDPSLPFGGDESEHRNWGLCNVPFKHPWVYHSDADERVTPELARAMATAVASGSSVVAYRIPRRDYFMGKWLKHVPPSPFNIRLFRPQHMRYERIINPVPIVDGEIGKISAHFDHFPFSKGLGHWVDKHNHLSTLEARQIVANRGKSYPISRRKAMFSRNVNERRFHQKEIFYRLPFRPTVMFILLYFVRGGFLDGGAGLTYALMRCAYEKLIVLKTRELEGDSASLRTGSTYFPRA
jgi:glycosyltransferase involved in cell wall biosynthesis